MSEPGLVVCLQNDWACPASRRRSSLRSASSTYAPGTPSSAGLARNAAAVRMPPHQFTDRPLDTGVLALVTLPFPGKPNSPEAAVQMSSLRDQHVAAALEGVPAEVYVGGVTAEVADFYGIVRVYTPIVFALVLGLSFIIPDDGLPVDCHSAEPESTGRYSVVGGG